ncbi:MAG: nucleoside deaminase [Caldisericia bacterium]|nr:nucleoside deaminase [Caldisericia bacterium]MDD4614645.1 nucleoside deaminase [Caldisericia bacterium]
MNQTPLHSYAEKYMQEALLEAKKAMEMKEVPVGCVIVRKGEIIAAEHNTVENDKSILSHAELKAIRRASKELRDWRLIACDLFVTMEPCNMCMGGILLSRLRSLYYGIHNPKMGAFSGPYAVSTQFLPFSVYNGILESEIETQLHLFFGPKRH